MRKTTIYGRDNHIISNVEEWFEYAPPKRGAKQWKDDYSAKELAKYFVNYLGHVPPEINAALDKYGSNDKEIKSFAEYTTPLDDFNSGEGRNHDLLMVGESIVVGIEAKVKESLDYYVLDKIKDATPTAKERYEMLCRAILNKNIEECENIRYQLLSATAGTLIEAEKANVNKAALLIVVLKFDGVSDTTRNDVDNFKLALKPFQKSDGSFNIPYKPNINLFIDYIEINPLTYLKEQQD